MTIIRRSVRTVQSVTFALGMVALASAAEVHFGPTRISPLETARLNAVCDGSAPASCQMTFEFRATNGQMLLSRTLTLQPGTSGFVDFTAPRTGIAVGPGEIDPCWDIAFGAAFVSLEVFDTATFRTRMLINWGDRSLPRAGDVDFAPAGITPTETARVGVFCPADERGGGSACNVLVEFHDINGRTLKQETLRLEPGTSGFSDLRFAEAASAGRRITIDPCFKVGDGGPVVGTLAIFDDALGQPGAQAYPATLAAAQ